MIIKGTGKKDEKMKNYITYFIFYATSTSESPEQANFHLIAIRNAYFDERETP